MQFRELPRRVPWKAILLAIALLAVGTLLLVLGCLFYTGHIPPAHVRLLLSTALLLAWRAISDVWSGVVLGRR